MFTSVTLKYLEYLGKNIVLIQSDKGKHGIFSWISEYRRKECFSKYNTHTAS